MIQYARLAYFSFFLILKYLFNLILAKIPEPGLPNTAEKRLRMRQPYL
jgi:hypothetical protein